MPETSRSPPARQARTTRGFGCRGRVRRVTSEVVNSNWHARGPCMPELDSSVIADPSRVAAARRATRVVPGLAIPLDGIAGSAARLLHAPIGAVSVISEEFDDCVGAY